MTCNQTNGLSHFKGQGYYEQYLLYSEREGIPMNKLRRKFFKCLFTVVIWAAVMGGFLSGQVSLLSSEGESKRRDIFTAPAAGVFC